MYNCTLYKYIYLLLFCRRVCYCCHSQVSSARQSKFYSIFFVFVRTFFFMEKNLIRIGRNSIRFFVRPHVLYSFIYIHTFGTCAAHRDLHENTHFESLEETGRQQIVIDYLFVQSSYGLHYIPQFNL